MAVAVYKFLKKTNYYSEDGNGDSEGSEEQDSGPWLWGAVNQLAKTWTEEQVGPTTLEFWKCRHFKGEYLFFRETPQESSLQRRRTRKGWITWKTSC